MRYIEVLTVLHRPLTGLTPWTLDFDGLFAKLAHPTCMLMPKKNYNLSTESKKSGSDFGRANSAASLVKKTFEPLTKKYWDATFFIRLRRLMIMIINTGDDKLKGKLEITDGDLALLNIDFNSERNIDSLFNFRPELKLEKAECLTVRLPEMIPRQSFKHSAKATSAVISFVCAIFHFDLGKGGYSGTKELEIPLNNDAFSRKKINFLCRLRRTA